MCLRMSPCPINQSGGSLNRCKAFLESFTITNALNDDLLAEKSFSVIQCLNLHRG